MTEIHFWLADCEHECCGDRRKVGDEIAANLTFVGVAEPTEEPDSVLPLDNGAMLVAGEVTARRGGRLLRSGAVAFGIDGRGVGAPRARCRGQLWESRHDTTVTGKTRGRITGIRWRPSMESDRKSMIVGYALGEVVYDTDKRPGVEDLEPLSTYIEQPEPPSPAWAFVFTIEVSEPSDLS